MTSARYLLAAAVLVGSVSAASACEYLKSKETAQTPVPAPTAQAPIQTPAPAQPVETAQTAAPSPTKTN